ncbi:MAG: type II toxin-antitoxin system RatA family toxin [Gammaproteobacteria bacterium]
MQRLSKTVTLHYTPEAMYKLVADIPSYHSFLPYCQASSMHAKSDSIIQGTIQVGYKGLHYKLVTLNQMVPFKQINLKFVEGPFKTLNGRWSFNPLPSGGCEVMLQLQYEFKNFLLALMLDRIMAPAVEMIVNHFIARAREKYGSARQ